MLIKIGKKIFESFLKNGKKEGGGAWNYINKQSCEKVIGSALYG